MLILMPDQLNYWQYCVRVLYSITWIPFY